MIYNITNKHLDLSRNRIGKSVGFLKPEGKWLKTQSTTANRQLALAIQHTVQTVLNYNIDVVDKKIANRWAMANERDLVPQIEKATDHRDAQIVHRSGPYFIAVLCPV